MEFAAGIVLGGLVGWFTAWYFDRKQLDEARKQRDDLRAAVCELFARGLQHTHDGLEGIRLVGTDRHSGVFDNEGPRIIGGKLDEVEQWLQRFEGVRPRIESLPDGLARVVEHAIVEAQRVHAAVSRYARPYIEGATSWTPGGEVHVRQSWLLLMQEVEHVVGVLNNAILALRRAGRSERGAAQPAPQDR